MGNWRIAASVSSSGKVVLNLLRHSAGISAERPLSRGVGNTPSPSGYVQLNLRSTYLPPLPCPIRGARKILLRTEHVHPLPSDPALFRPFFCHEAKPTFEA